MDGCSDLRDALKSLETTEEKTKAPNRLDQYKRNHAVPSQEDRRKQFLQSVKERRQDFISQARLIALGEDEDEEEDEDQEMDTTSVRTSYRKKPYNHQKKHLKNQLMLSEWLVELPTDFEQEWLMVPCPVGKRSLVVASRGRTKVYSRTGHLLSIFSSHIPGGNRHGDRSTYTILDCVFCKDTNVLYVLDIMCWAGHPIYDCDTTFRFYWLQTKLQEVPDLMTLSDLHQKKFVTLTHHPCNLATVQQVLLTPLPFALDGLLFYHKACPYLQGVSPLVGWLKAYMVPEVMKNVVVPEALCNDKPKDYVSMEQYLVKAFKKVHQMDCEQSPVSKVED